MQSSHRTDTLPQCAVAYVLLLWYVPSHLGDRQEDWAGQPRHAATAENSKSGLQRL